MSEIAVRVEHAWKRYRMGELHDSLRDLIPAALRRLARRAPKRDADGLAAGQFWALRDVSFTVTRGASLGIIGPNGAGKSTLLKLLSRIIRADRGTCSVEGRVAALIDVGAGFHPDLTGRENIYLSGSILGIPRREIRRREAQIIDFAEVDRFIDTPVKRYSSGMRARLGFAVAAHMDAEILLVDEVLSVGDLRFRRKCVRHMRELVASQTTVLFVSHVLDQVRVLCPETLVLDHGSVVFHGPTDEALRTYVDLLAVGAGDEVATGDEVSVGSLRLFDAEGTEHLRWQSRRAGALELCFEVHRPLPAPNLSLRFVSPTGVFLGAAESLRQGVRLPSEPGSYRLRYVMDPVPFCDGCYYLDVRLFADAERQRCLWGVDPPLTLWIEGSGVTDGFVACGGAWYLERVEAAAVEVAGVAAE